MSFDVGDKVVYPHHGAAVIERREWKDWFGADREYLVLKLAYGLKVNAGELFVGFTFDVIRKLKL